MNSLKEHNVVILMNHWEFIQPTTVQPCPAEDRCFESILKLYNLIKNRPDWTVIISEHSLIDRPTREPLQNLLLEMKNCIVESNPMRLRQQFMSNGKNNRLYYTGMHTNYCCFHSPMGIHWTLVALHYGSYSLEIIDECTASLSNDEKHGITNNELELSPLEYMKEQNLRKIYIKDHLVSLDTVIKRHDLR